MTTPGALDGKILACDKCANVASLTLINEILACLTNSDRQRLLLTCNICLGNYRIMTKAHAGEIAVNYVGQKIGHKNSVAKYLIAKHEKGEL